MGVMPRFCDRIKAQRPDASLNRILMRPRVSIDTGAQKGGVSNRPISAIWRCPANGSFGSQLVRKPICTVSSPNTRISRVDDVMLN
jgi:hypothetical protein